jgi:hypothetical protein
MLRSADDDKQAGEERTRRLTRQLALSGHEQDQFKHTGG